jgi:hypothetical protein
LAFFETATSQLGKIILDLAKKSLATAIESKRRARQLQRLVDDAVDRIVEQAEAYLDAEKLAEQQKELLVVVLCDRLRAFADDPQRLFRANLDGQRIFEDAHPGGRLPQEIREEGLDQFYSVLFPQIAQLVVSSPVALQAWQADGYREGFRRLSQIADEVSSINAKVAEVPTSVLREQTSQVNREADQLLRDLRQTLLSQVLLRIDLSPLRAEREIKGSLLDHFVVPAVQERRQDAKVIGTMAGLVSALTRPAARSIVHGPPGIGKTTCAMWLQSTLLQTSGDRLAIVLKLRGTKDLENRTVASLLRDLASVHHRDRLTDEVVRRWYEGAALVLIIDGFDELPEERRDAVERWILELSTVAKGATVLVTTRPLHSGHLGSRAAGPEWRHWDLLPFDKPRIVEFITRWHRHLPEDELTADERILDAEHLAETFMRDPSLQPLSNTPLMLSTLLFVHHRDKKLPRGRCDLYQRYISAMLGLRDSGLGIQARATRLDDSAKRKVLGQIALHFHMTGVSQVTDSEMREIVSEALVRFHYEEDVDRLMAALSERTGLLQGPGTWSFTHKTIGEFLMAELVREGTASWKDGSRLDRMALWNHRHDDVWTAVLFFWAGLASEREFEEFIRELIAERTEPSTLLALSLLSDQGERLLFETQREFTSTLCGWTIGLRSARDGGWSGTAFPIVPRAMCPENMMPDITLRGMNQLDLSRALVSFVNRGLVDASAIAKASATMKVFLVRALLKASKGQPTEAAHQDDTADTDILAEYLSRRDLAIYRFPFEPNHIPAWLARYPDCEGWLPFLVLGMLKYSGRERWAQVLWQYRNTSIAEDWLLASDDCVGGKYSTVFTSADSAPSSDDFFPFPAADILNEGRGSLLSLDLAACNLSASQGQDLISLCDQLLARRTKLKGTG